MKRAVTLGLIILIVFAAFYPSLKNGFTNWDDNVYVLDNPMIKDFSPSGLARLFTTLHRGLYKPLVLASFACEYHFFKLNPLAYHATNLVFHLANCLLVFWVISLLCGDPRVSFAVALLFGIHPMHVESVAWISERKDMFYAFFFLLAFGFYLRYVKEGGRRNYWFSFLSFILSLTAKPMALLFPFLMMASDWRLGAKSIRSALANKIPFFIVSAGFTILTAYAARSYVPKVQGFTFLDSLLIGFYGIIFYLQKIFVPVKLSGLYPYPGGAGTAGSWFLTSGLYVSIVASLLALVIFFRRRSKDTLFAAVLFASTLLPVLQILPTGPAPVADRYTYIPYIGPFFLIAEWCVYFYDRNLRRRAQKAVALIFGIAVICTLSILTWERTKVWESGVTLWNDCLKNYPGSPLAYNTLGYDFMERGQLDQAMLEFNKAIRMDPCCADAYINRGAVFVKKSEYDKALSDFNRAIKINPGDPEAYFNRAWAFRVKGDRQSAISDYNKAISIKPDSAKNYFALADLYDSIGNESLASEYFEKTLEVDSFFEDAYYRVALIYGKRGQHEQAVGFLLKAVRINPGFTEALMNLGSAYGALGDFDRSITYSRKALKINPDLGLAYGNLAAAYYSRGEYGLAQECSVQAGRLGVKVPPELQESIGRDKK